MIRNIITTTIRHFYKYKGYTLTNIFGLAIGLSTCLLIFLYVQDEMSYDGFFTDAENIYRMEPHWVGQGEDSHWAATQGSVLPEITRNYPEVVSSVKIHKPYHPPVFTRDDKRFREKFTLYADSSFFEVFDFKILKGDPATMLRGSGKIVLSQSAAQRYFGQEDPMGKFLRIDSVSYMIAGITEGTPRNSHLKYDVLISLDHMRSQWNGVDRDGPETFYSYLKFADENAAEEVICKYNNNIYTHLGMVVAGDSTNVPEDWEVNMIFNPITNIHLNGHAEKEISQNSDRKYVVIFSAVALFVLIIACFNYMNLATAKSTRRSREVGLRKVLGASLTSIIGNLSREFIILIALANVAAWIPAFLFVQEWLNGFSFRTGISFWIFAASAGVSLLIAISTVGAKAWASVRSNPVDSLRTD